MLFRFSIVIIGAIFVFFLSYLNSKDYNILKTHGESRIRVVGSSTVFPFSSVAAEYFGKKTKSPTPIIEATGTGGGMQAFCAGIGFNMPDMVNASREMKQSEIETCKQNDINDIVEIPLGYDGIVIAGSRFARDNNFNLTKKQIFLALAAKIPHDGKLISNPYQRWNDISPELPNKIIKFLGPPPTSGTRDSFAEMVLQEGCKKVHGAKELGLYKKSCNAIREDGHWQDMGENDNLIVQKVNADHDNIGIFGFAYYDQNKNLLKASRIEGEVPTFERIKKNKYPVARPLYVYLKKDHISLKPSLKYFAYELLSDDAAGEFGYLSARGLVPISKDIRQNILDSI